MASTETAPFRVCNWNRTTSIMRPKSQLIGLVDDHQFLGPSNGASIGGRLGTTISSHEEAGLNMLQKQ